MPTIDQSFPQLIHGARKWLSLKRGPRFLPVVDAQLGTTHRGSAS
jgi:hypothetical protein